jgi:hypothetical protein
MLRRRLLTFAALVAAHAAASVTAAFFALQVAASGGPEWLGGAIFYPFWMPLLGLLGLIWEEPPYLDPGLAVAVNSVLWVAGACCLWLAGRWAWRNGRAAR